jgi:uncharacterized sulfatase
MQPVYDFMEATERPWFIWFSPLMPHSPHEAPDEYVALYQGLGLSSATIEYYAMISWFDAVVGELLAAVDDDTVVIFLADNGFVQSDAPIVPAPKSKDSSYEHGIRTQLLIRHPDRRPQSRRTIVDAADVVATLLAIADADATDLPGQDILGRNIAKRSAFGSRSTSGVVVAPGTLLERWIRLEDWKLVDVEDSSGEEDRLHNLRRDPEELENLIGTSDSGSMESELRTDLEKRWRE